VHSRSLRTTLVRSLQAAPIQFLKDQRLAAGMRIAASPIVAESMKPGSEQSPLTREAVIDAVARVVARRGPTGLRWSTIAREAGGPSVSRAWRWFQDMPALIEECYSRTAQGLEESLLRAETAPGTALDKLAAFLVAALEVRRERGSLLSFRPTQELALVQRKRLRERELMVRTRLKRLLMKGQRDGSLALRHADAGCSMILACLQAPDMADDGPSQQMWDAELVELLLAALAEPHAPEPVARCDVPVTRGACACGTVRYEVEGPFDVMSQCHCAMCRKHHGSAFATFISAPLCGFRWLAGADVVTTYRSATIGQRSFCSVCGSVTATPEPETGVVYCPWGKHTGEPSAAPSAGCLTWASQRRDPGPESPSAA
jgi:AcrR family transcriptional regulator